MNSPPRAGLMSRPSSSASATPAPQLRSAWHPRVALHRSRLRPARCRRAGRCAGGGAAYRCVCGSEADRSVRRAAPRAARPRDMPRPRPHGARRPWLALSQCAAGRLDPRDRGAQHRARHHCARGLPRARGSGERNEAPDAGGAQCMIFGIGIDVLELERMQRGSTESTASTSWTGCCCAGRSAQFRAHGAAGALSRHAVRGQGSHRQGHGHGLRTRHVDSRCRRRAEPLGQARSDLFGARSPDVRVSSALAKDTSP